MAGKFGDETYVHVSGDSSSMRLDTFESGASTQVTSATASYATTGTAVELASTSDMASDIVVYGILTTGFGTDTAGGNVIIYDDTTTVADPQIIVHTMEDDNAFISIPPVKFEAGHAVSVVYASASASAGTCYVKVFYKKGYY